MPVNDLLPFGIGVGANVMSQGTYAGHAFRQSGFTAGTAESAQLNKVWRQAAFTSSMIGEFTMHNALEDVLDDGNVAEYERKFKKAVQAVAELAGLRRAATGGTGSAATISFGTRAFTSLGTPVIFLADITTNLLDNATLNIDGLGARDIYRTDGVRIQEGDAPAGSVLMIVYDGSSRFEIINLTSQAVQAGAMNSGGTFGGTVNQMVVTLNPAPPRYRDGLVIRGRVPGSVSNTLNPTMNVNSLGEKQITTPLGTDFPVGEIKGGMTLEGVYNAVADKIVITSSTRAPNTSGFDTVKQPAFYARNNFGGAVPSGLTYFASGFTLLHNRLGDATFNTSNGHFTVGPNTAGLWSFFVNDIPAPINMTDTVGIQSWIMNPGTVTGLLSDSTADIDVEGGESPFVHLSYATWMDSGQQIQTYHQSRVGGYAMRCNHTGIRISS